jgi:hypothetical protein
MSARFCPHCKTTTDDFQCHCGRVTEILTVQGNDEELEKLEDDYVCDGRQAVRCPRKDLPKVYVGNGQYV